MSIKPERVQFNGGELSPWLEGRTDIAKYDKTAKLCRNFIPLPEGSLKRRGGTRFVAVTPEDAGVLFQVEAVPLEAKITIGGEVCSQAKAARGDTLSYEVTADGYAGKSGSLVLTEDTTLKVSLVSLWETCTLTIVPEPEDAMVKIGGYARTSAAVNKGAEASYAVFKDGYVLQSGTVLMNADKTITVTLAEDAAEAVSYGDWGNLVGLAACSAVGRIEVQERCFYIRFTNGYLPVIFNSKEKAPAYINEGLFFYSLNDGYNAVCYKDGKYANAIASAHSQYFEWRSFAGERLMALDYGSMGVFGWQIQNGWYALFYKGYEGVVSNNQLKVYCDGELVWELKGRDNG